MGPDPLTVVRSWGDGSLRKTCRPSLSIISMFSTCFNRTRTVMTNGTMTGRTTRTPHAAVPGPPHAGTESGRQAGSLHPSRNKHKMERGGFRSHALTTRKKTLKRILGNSRGRVLPRTESAHTRQGLLQWQTNELRVFSHGFPILWRCSALLRESRAARVTSTRPSSRQPPRHRLDRQWLRMRL